MLTAGQSAHLEVNGVRLFCEVHGAGKPLVLLHGGMGATEMFGPNLEFLARTRQAIGVHLHGHGKSGDADRPFRYETMADDIAALIRALGVGAVDLLGYSLGGGVALQTAIRHPDVVDRLIVAAAEASNRSWFPEVQAQFKRMPANAEAMGAQVAASPFGQMHPRVDFANLFRKIGEMHTAGFDWSNELGAIRARTLLLFADADIIPPRAIADFYAALGGGRGDPGWEGADRTANQLAVLPGTTHYNLFTTTLAGELIERFLA
jgi:pimeloyl-ACP methyl ester carboxylesterase